MSDTAGVPGTPGQPEPTAADTGGSAWERLTRDPGALFRLGLFPGLGVLVAIGIVTALTGLNTILVALVVSLFMALGLQPVIDWLMRRRLPRWAAAGIVAVGVLGLLALGVAALVPLVTEQVAAFIDEAPGYLEALRTNATVARLDEQFGILDRARGALESGSWVTQVFGGVLGAGAAAANLALAIVLTTVLTLYFTWSAPSIKDAIYELAPASKRPRVRYLANEIFQRIGDYLLAMLVVVGIWGVLTFVVLWVFGLGQYALALALVVMALVVIPAVGSTIGALLCALVALSVSPFAAIGVLVSMLAYQQVDAYVVQPRLFARSLDVPPALVILGAACGLTLFGLVGALLAIPTVASLLLLHREVIVPKLDAS